MKRLAVLAGALLFAAGALDVTPSLAQEGDKNNADAHPKSGAAEPEQGSSKKPAAQAPDASQSGGGSADKKAAGDENKGGGREASDKQTSGKEKAAESKVEKREDREDRKVDRNDDKRDSKDDAAKAEKADNSGKDDNSKAREAKDNDQKGKDAKEAKDDSVKSGSNDAKDDTAKLPDRDKAAAGGAAKDVKKDSATDKTPDANPGDSQARDQRDRDGQEQQRDQASSKRQPAERVRQVDLPQEKRERVRSSFRRIDSARQVNNISIEISIGRRLPSDWSYRPVPIEIIEIVPEYSGYEFAYVEDRYVIVEPDTHEVVYVIDGDEHGDGGRYSQQSAAAGRADGTAGRSDDACPANFTFQKDEREFILEKIEMQKAVAIVIDDVKLGLVLPGDMRFERFPDDVTRRFSVLEPCRYVVLDDKDAEIAIVDPKDKKVVLLIEVNKD